MLIGGLQKSSLIDYPKKIAAVVFLQGCNFRCPYCHNPELVLPRTLMPFQEKEFFEFLKKRVGKLDGVVVTGGEPTIHKDLSDFISKIKNLGFEVKLDTNGTNPDVVENLINKNLVDYLAMDIKTSFDEYEKITGKTDIQKVKETFKLIVEGKVDYEFRTTVVKELMTFESFEKIKTSFNEAGGVKRYNLQKFQKSKHLIEEYINAKTFEDDEFEKLEELFSGVVEEFMIR